MTRVVLFGASGFIGRYVATALEADPTVTSVRPVGRATCDLQAVDVDGLEAVLRSHQPDAIVNCTGLLDGSSSELLQSNTMVVAKLIDACARIRPGIRLVRLGSAGEYGPVPEGESVTENSAVNPVSDYGLSHWAATRQLSLATQDGRVSGATLRVFNPIGGGVSSANVLGRAAAKLKDAVEQGESVLTLGPLTAYRDFVDVRDVARGVATATVASSLPYSVFNIASGRAVTVRTAVERLAEVAGFKGEIEEVGTGSARSASVSWIRADISRAATVFGWQPQHDLDDTVTSIWSALAEAS
ncbi:NAD-dependent epimerase/dehydratase family protein [Tenggerimyces flavus]|uniref:NAD-dependent epimerase/dehydratase family protein n=1 Tax=Tenggerimyces flavus TaxID=1708749 RepID=A0ABV7Y4C5_9ACTN|nr:NAD(P)-dependent oxidoreductase [Tenggerimyces flavus]MBM7790498.1 nucleoside-diphosphate-sugar epimerase [Tenggerimyces flavus]